jgi:hypothetical protein
MSKLDEAPFKVHDEVEWFQGNPKSSKKVKRVGVISDAYYQKETKSRKEGWRILIRKGFIDGENTHLEKNFDQVRRC